MYDKDIKRIQKVARQYNLVLTEEQTKRLWKLFSEEFYAAGWIGISDTKQIITALIHYSKCI